MPVQQLQCKYGPQSDFVMVDADLDWITATHTRGGRERQAFEFGKSMVDHEAKSGDPITAISWRGYRGFSCGHVSVGRRWDGVFLQARSGAAGTWYQSIKEFATNFARIDCAVTGLTSEQEPQVFRRAYTGINARSRVGHKRAEVTIIANDLRGDSLYFGRRMSDRYGRFYDKGAEQKISEPGWLFRWELECKRAYAKLVAGALAENSCSKMVAHEIASRYFEGFGIRSPAPAVEMYKDPVKLACAAKPFEGNQKLAWLTNSCRPVVKRLVGQGRIDDVGKALGLSIKDGQLVYIDDGIHLQ